MENLPVELRLDILSWLPVESLLRFRCVSKTWRSIIDDPFLKRLHTNRLLLLELDSGNSLSFIHYNRFARSECLRFCYGSYNDDDHHEHKDEPLDVPISFYGYTLSTSFKCPNVPGYKVMMSSCHGLICVFSRYRDLWDERTVHIDILNPVIREHVSLPNCIMNVIPSLVSDVPGRSGFGFGYSHSTNEYKVVFYYPGMIKNELTGMIVEDMQVEVYILGSGKWRKISNVVLGSGENVRPLYKFNRSHRQLVGTLFNGSLHWINYEGKIIQFDLATEEFRHFPTCFKQCQDRYSFSHYSYWNLVILNGMLCAVMVTKDWSRVPMVSEVWILRNGAWIQELPSIRSRPSSMLSKADYQFITLTKRMQDLVLNGKPKTRSFVYYDRVGEEFKLRHRVDDEDVANDRRPSGVRAQPIPHIKSFVSLRMLGENPTIYNT